MQYKLRKHSEDGPLSQALINCMIMPYVVLTHICQRDVILVRVLRIILQNELNISKNSAIPYCMLGHN